VTSQIKEIAMIGFVIITHRPIGHAMLSTVETILKEKPNFRLVEVVPDATSVETQHQIREAIRSFPHANGVILLIDIFGATPSNLCKEFLEFGKVEMITGCNLPILIKAATTDFKESPSQAAQFLKEYGKDNIRVYSTDF
jgi:PTS system mannose-specific IIA component